MLAFMADNGIDTGAIARISDRTVGLYMIAVSAGERTFTLLALAIGGEGAGG